MSSINLLNSFPRDHFQCSICANIFNDPVSTPCGHSFCKTCLDQRWDQSEFCQCPTCHKRFPVRPELGTNAVIEEISVELKRRKLETPEVADGPTQVPCEVCTETPFRAQKSCLVCQTSYCSVHLEPHMRVPGLIEHKLIDPVDDIQARICPLHKRVLELYCRDDEHCICQICDETDHIAHDVASVEEEAAAQKDSIGSKIERVQMMIDERTDKIKEVTDFTNIRTEKAQKETENMDSLLDQILAHAQETKTYVKTLIEEKLRKYKEKDEAIIKQLQEEIDRLQLKRSELEELLQNDDPFHLLKNASVPSETEDWTKTRVHTDVFVETLRLTLTHLMDTFQTLMKNLIKREITTMKQYKEPLTFDPSTAGRRLAVYESGKRVKHHKYASSPDSDDSERFELPMVFGTTGFTSGHHYWEVQVGVRCDWDVGVAKETVTRKGQVTVKVENGFYSIGKKGPGYRVNCSPYKALHLSPRPTNIGVYLDYEDGRVSFFDVDTEVHIHSFTGENFTGKLYPYFYLYSCAKKSEPMAISTWFDYEFVLARLHEEKEKQEKQSSVNSSSDTSFSDVSVASVSS